MSFIRFLMTAAALLTGLPGLVGTSGNPALWILTLVCTLLAAGFGTTLVRHPLRQPSWRATRCFAGATN